MSERAQRLSTTLDAVRELMQKRLDTGSLDAQAERECPECHGVLARIREGSLMRFRCHTGHAYSVGTLLDALGAQVEDRLFDALRSVDENVMLLGHLGEHLAAAGQTREAEK